MGTEPADPTPDLTQDPVAATSQATDAQLLAAHVDGDADAFGQLFTRHRDRLWAVALRTCHDPEMAADALQEALISAFRRAETFRGDAAVTTWLHRIVVNACLDRLRAASVRRTEPLPDDLDATSDLDIHRRAHVSAGWVDTVDTVDPADASVTEERRRQVRAALATLPLEQRAALVLVDMEGYSVAEAAVLLECAEGTIKSRCSRGRARLAALLADVLHLDEGDEHDTRPLSHTGNPIGRPDVGSVTPRGPPAASV